MGLNITSVFSLVLPMLLFPGNFVAGPSHVPGSTGIDISYPNCRAVVPTADFDVVGVNGGKVFTMNPCLLRQSMLQGKTASLYANTGWNSKITINDSPKKCAAADKRCLAYNYGYTAGAQAYSQSKQGWILSNTWWLDVEFANTWNDDTEQNRSSLQGEYDALKTSGVVNVGVYSTSHQWQKITGSWKNGWPNWAATVVETSAEAKGFCKQHEFSGGPTLLVQYMPKASHVDHNIAC